ncbi:LysR family transcriptional regulator [Mucilaginibacter jinjuensis]|uniref:LysR family transcriptional regulator n=1 Tax=Mucilaginibacter jinjuensis TaxID=1176721 RepID=A0ABY7TDM1_9SPHI|nr:LysR family transcriptional regulator [Mucilaginibacter jinjuensis]WCT14293.1 LysR family transcriptional regulator [Mucilaginibacter jinjuensis]
MYTNDIKIFEAVAAHGNFTRAAEATFTVQSNVTARIKSLEEEFGAELFDRSARKVELTAAGKILIQYLKQIGHLMDEAKKELTKSGQISGSLKIGCVETTMALKAPGIISQFAEQYPEVDLEFKSAMRTELINDVLNYKLDAAFVSAPISNPELSQIVVKNERIAILTPAKHKKLEDTLRAVPLKIVVFELGCIFRSRLESFLSSKGIVEYKRITVNSLEGIINFVEAGLGISMLPEELVQEYYSTRKLNLFPLSKDLGTMTTLLVTRSGVPLSRAFNAFIDLYKASSESSGALV